MAYTQFQFRRDTAANWASNNPILAEGEMGVDTSTGSIKIGDGSTAWNSLGFGNSTLDIINTVAYNDGGTSTLNHLGGNAVFTLTSNGTSTTIAHSNVPSGVRFGFELHLTWTSGAITFPASWSRGENPPSTTGNYLITGITIDGGTSFTLTVVYQ